RTRTPSARAATPHSRTHGRGLPRSARPAPPSGAGPGKTSRPRRLAYWLTAATSTEPPAIVSSPVFWTTTSTWLSDTAVVDTTDSVARSDDEPRSTATGV